MPTYRVLMDAKNFLIDMAGKRARYGFITFRLVEAANPVAAENAAVQLTRDDPGLRDLVLNETDDPPVIDVVEVALVDSQETPAEQTGYIWYEMSPKRWWQFWRS